MLIFLVQKQLLWYSLFILNGVARLVCKYDGCQTWRYDSLICLCEIGNTFCISLFTFQVLNYLLGIKLFTGQVPKSNSGIYSLHSGFITKSASPLPIRHYFGYPPQLSPLLPLIVFIMFFWVTLFSAFLLSPIPELFLQSIQISI